MVGARAAVLAELATLIDKGTIDVPIAAVYPLDQVRDAYRELERPHAGKDRARTVTAAGARRRTRSA